MATWNKKDEKPVAQERPIETLSFEALLDLKSRVDAEVSTRSSTELEALKSRLLLVATTTGVEIGDLFGIKAAKKEKGKKKREARPKYRDPETGEEWSGRGHPPAWMKEKLEAGAEKDDFLIDTVVHLNS